MEITRRPSQIARWCGLLFFFPSPHKAPDELIWFANVIKLIRGKIRAIMPCFFNRQSQRAARFRRAGATRERRDIARATERRGTALPVRSTQLRRLDCGLRTQTHTANTPRAVMWQQTQALTQQTLQRRHDFGHFYFVCDHVHVCVCLCVLRKYRFSVPSLLQFYSL